MTDHKEVLRDLSDAIVAIQPIWDKLVLVGGLVPWIYRGHPSFEAPPHPALFTADIDWAVPLDLDPTCGRLTDLLEDSGFVRLPNRSTKPPISMVQHGRHGSTEPASISMEFLAPLSGPSHTRDGQPRVSALVQGTLGVQLLRYMELALHQPMSVDLQHRPGLSFGPSAARLQVPHPTNFLVHKLLVMPLRPAVKRDKDAAYLFDLALLSRPSWPTMRARLEDLTHSSNSPANRRWLNAARATATQTFASPAAAGCVGAARVLNDAFPQHPLTTDRVHRVMQRFLGEVGLGPQP